MKSKELLFLLLLVSSQSVSCQEDISIERKVQFERLYTYDAPTSNRYAQGMDIINGDIFQGFSDGTIDVISLSKNCIIQTLDPIHDPKGKILHMNDISFKKVGDKVLLIVPGNGINSNIIVFSVFYDENGFYKLKQEMELMAPYIDDVKYKAATQLFGDVNTIVQVAYKRTADDGYGDSYIEGYTFDEFKSEIQYEKKWSIEHEIMWAMQGATFNGVNCYLAVGVPHGDAKIFKIDTTKGIVTCYINFREEEDTLKEEEMQGVAFYNGSLYFSTTYGVYKVL